MAKRPPKRHITKGERLILLNLRLEALRAVRRDILWQLHFDKVLANMRGLGKTSFVVVLENDLKKASVEIDKILTAINSQEK